MFDDSDTNAGEERRGTDPSVIGNVNTTRGGGAESTSTLGSVVGVERPETGGGIRVSVDPGGDLETVIFSTSCYSFGERAQGSDRSGSYWRPYQPSRGVGRQSFEGKW